MIETVAYGVGDSPSWQCANCIFTDRQVSLDIWKSLPRAGLVQHILTELKFGFGCPLGSVSRIQHLICIFNI